MAKHFNKVINFFKKAGSGLITGASDDDPSGIATYSQAGAQFGLTTLWTALITFPLMMAIQEMSARIGMITSHGLTGNIKKHYPKYLLFLIIVLTVPAIVVNIAADLAGMAAVGQLLLPQIPVKVSITLFAILLLVMMIYFPYQRIATILKYFCLFLLLYILVPFVTKNISFTQVLANTFIPTIHFDEKYLNILVAILGTTISPYLFFWQATMESEDKRHKHKKSQKEMRLDVALGMFLSNLVMYFIIFTTGTVLFNAGITDIQTVEQAAKALQPIAGEMSYAFFAIGILGTGFLSIPVLTASISYIITTAIGVKGGLDLKLYQAKIFYFIIILSLLLGLAIDFLGISPIKSLIFSATLYGLCAPILIVIIMHIANNKKIMNKNTNGILSNIMGTICFIFMSAAAGCLVYFQIHMIR